MGAFGNESQIPEWLNQQFDSRTALPLGPLQHLPIPLDGQITSASSCVPANGDPSSWEVIAACAETIDEALRFYKEYLPLAGFDIIARGQVVNRRGWFGRTERTNEVIVVHRGLFVGGIDLRLGPPPASCYVDARMAQSEHPRFKMFKSREGLRSLTDVRWYDL